MKKSIAYLEMVSNTRKTACVLGGFPTLRVSFTDGERTSF